MNKIDMSAPCVVGDFVTFTGFKLAAGDTAPVELKEGTKLKVTNTDSWAEQQLLEVELPDDATQTLPLYAGEFEIIPAGHEIGDIVKFLGYAEVLEENILKEGDVVTIISKQKDEDGFSFEVALLSDPTVKESLFDTEIEAMDEKEIKAVTKKTKEKAEVKPARKKASKKTEAVEDEGVPVIPGVIAKEVPAKLIARVEDADVAETPAVLSMDLAVSKNRKEEPTDRTPPTVVSKEVKLVEEVQSVAHEPSNERNSISIISPTFSVESVTGDEATAIHAVHSLRENINDSFYVMGGVLTAIYDKKYYLASGFTSFDDYVKGTLESGVCPVGVRTAKYLVNIFRTFDELGYTLESIKASGLGWGKLKEIARIDYQDEKKFPSSEDADKVARQLLDFAKDHNGDELREQVKAIMEEGSTITIGKEVVTDESETVDVWQAKFKLKGAEGEIVQQAMDASKECLKATGQVVGDDEAIYYMASQWLLNDSGIDLPKEQVIAGVCQRYGISLIEKGEAEYSIEDGEVKITELK